MFIEKDDTFFFFFLSKEIFQQIIKHSHLKLLTAGKSEAWTLYVAQSANEDQLNSQHPNLIKGRYGHD